MSEKTLVKDYHEYRKRLTKVLPDIMGADVELTGLELDYNDGDEIMPDFKTRSYCYFTIRGKIDLTPKE